jgi:hypothetical protein
MKRLIKIKVSLLYKGTIRYSKPSNLRRIRYADPGKAVRRRKLVGCREPWTRLVIIKGTHAGRRRKAY